VTPCKVEPAQTLGLAAIDSVIQWWTLTDRYFQPENRFLTIIPTENCLNRRKSAPCI
jgi:hypothetical protein